MDSRAFEFSVRNSELYTDVGGYSYTHADFIMFLQHINAEDKYNRFTAYEINQKGYYE